MTIYDDNDLSQHLFDNILLPDGTKPLADAMLTYHQLGSMALVEDAFTESAQDINA